MYPFDILRVGLMAAEEGDARTSPDEVDLLRLARLLKLKLGLGVTFVGDPVGLPGAEVEAGLLAFSASDSKNSTKRLEKDCTKEDVSMREKQSNLLLYKRLTSSPATLPFFPPTTAPDLPCPSFLPLAALVALPLRLLGCRPAFSFSSAVQFKTLLMRESISNLFESVRGVVRNCIRRFVINLPSTDESEVLARSLRNASVKCSFRITAVRPSE
jgi:hypothetical protein